MGKAIWELYGFSMGKSTHIYLPEKKTKLLDIFIQMIISPYDGLVRSQQRETFVHMQVIAHA